jgi:sodium-dependent phosphate cotransporter
MYYSFSIKKLYIPRIFKLLVYILGFFVALQVTILSFKSLNSQIITPISIATSNPFIALFIGILSTALLQSSTTVTSTIVAAVAAGMLHPHNAVYIVMGANIGTTVTSTIVSLGHIMRKKEFRRAFAAATLHDFFNILTTFILFPLEYFFHILSYLAKFFAQSFNFLSDSGIGNVVNPIKIWLEPLLQNIYTLLGGWAWVSLLLAFLALGLIIRGMASAFKQSLQENFVGVWEKYLFGSPLQSLFSGIIVTAFIHSSSLVTSLVVPIVASNRLSVKKSFPFLMGANIGTTVTALLASISQSESALQIALTHVFFNVIGVLILFPIPFLRNIPIWLARKLGKLVIKNRLLGLLYITIIFFIFPFLLIWLSR